MSAPFRRRVSQGAAIRSSAWTSTAARSRSVNEGRAPVLEPGLPEAIAEAVASRRLRATTDAAEAVRETDVSLVCVGTPSASQGSLSTRRARARLRGHRAALSATAASRHTVVVRSTVLPGHERADDHPRAGGELGPQGRSRLRLRRQPGVPARGQRRRRLRRSREDRDRRARRGERRPDRRDLRRLRGQRSSAFRSGSPRPPSTSTTPSTRSRSASPTRSARSASSSASTRTR